MSKIIVTQLTIFYFLNRSTVLLYKYMSVIMRLLWFLPLHAPTNIFSSSILVFHGLTKSDSLIELPFHMISSCHKFFNQSYLNVSKIMSYIILTLMMIFSLINKIYDAITFIHRIKNFK